MLILSACKVAEISPPAVEYPVVDENGDMICSIVPPLFAPLTPEQKHELRMFPEVTEDEYIKGPDDAIMTIVEYMDFFCPYCGLAYGELEKLMETYPEDVRLVYRALPLESLHPTAPLAAVAAEAAGKQGKFWEMYHAIFDNQEEAEILNHEELRLWLLTVAEEDLQLDMEQFEVDLDNEEILNEINAGVEKLLSGGVNSTPTILVNGRPVQSYFSNYLGNFIKVMKAEEGQLSQCPAFVIDLEKEYTATIETENGDIVLELYPKAAPLAVNSFVHLSRSGFYDSVTFHRVYHTFMAQAGDPTGTGWSGAGYQYQEEIVPELTFDEPYLLGVAKSTEANTSGSQFFITYVPYTSLNGQYTIFGKLIDGFDAFDKLTERDADSDPTLPEGTKIITINIDEK
jgi:cyclophilin family peptidyl-prolyl cis-trans isomerase/protein-disulfide isomerase